MYKVKKHMVLLLALALIVSSVALLGWDFDEDDGSIGEAILASGLPEFEGEGEVEEPQDDASQAEAAAVVSGFGLDVEAELPMEEAYSGIEPLAAAGAFDIEPATGWIFSTNTLTITDGGAYVIKMAAPGVATTNRIVVAPGVTADVTIDNVLISLPFYLEGCAFDLTGANVRLTLVGDSTLASGIRYAGLQAPSGSTLTIDGSGSLTASSYSGGAGIGGRRSDTGTTGLYDDGSSAGSITINSGTIVAIGGVSAAGIGGGFGGNSSASDPVEGGAGGLITINGGVVTATGGLAAAGIGGGQGSDGGDNAGKGGAGGFITINSGVVTAVGGSSNDGNIVTSFNGAGIGGGSGGVGSLGGTAGAGGDGGTITVNGGTVNASSGVNAAAVGGGQGGSGVLGANGNGGNGGTLVVSGGVLNATGGINAVGIGPGYPSIGTSSTAGNVGDETVVYYSYGTIVSRGEIQAILANFAEMPTGYEYWTSPDFGHDPGSSPGTVFGLGDASLSIPDYGTAFEVSSDDLFTKIIVWRLARVADVTVSGTVGDELPVGQQATLLLCGDTLASGLVDVNASAWFDNLPADLVVLANGSAGQRFITLYFSGIPELEGVTVFDIVIPGSLLASELDLAVMLNPLAVFNIVEAEGGGDNGGDNGNGSDNGNTGTDKPSKPNKPSTPATGDTGYLLLLAMLVLMVLGWLCLHAYGQSQDNTDMALKVVR